MSNIKNITRTIELIPEGTVLSAPVSKTLEVRGVESCTLLAKLGGAGSDTVSFTVESTDKKDSTDFYRMVNIEDANGDSIITKRTFKFTMTGASDLIEIPLNLQNEFVRVTVSSSNTSGTIGLKYTRVE